MWAEKFVSFIIINDDNELVFENIVQRFNFQTLNLHLDKPFYLTDWVLVRAQTLKWYYDEHHVIFFRKMNYPFHWETYDGKRLGNVYVARWYEKEFNCWIPFITAPELMEEFKNALADKTLDMDHNYNLDFIKRLRAEYEHISLLYSGG